jgi:replication factor C subunit 1
MIREKNYKVGFKKPGKDGMGIFRAVLISGPPGIGKTTSAHLVAKQVGYNPLELNASDARSKKLIEVSSHGNEDSGLNRKNSTNIDNTSLDGFFAGKGVQVSQRVVGCRWLTSEHCSGRSTYRQQDVLDHGRGGRYVGR